MQERPQRDGCNQNVAPANRAPYIPTRRRAWRTQLVSPPTLVIYVLALNIVLTGFGLPGWLIGAALAVAGIGLAIVAPYKLTLGWAVFVAVCTLCYLAIPALYRSSGTVLLGFVALWMLRFAGMFAAFIAAGFALDVHQLGAALTRMHAPRWLYVPIMVVARFFPMAVSDLRAIVEALSLRGLTPSPAAAIRHPLQLGEYVVIPFLASAARVADELSAAAIIKGLGSSAGRTSVVRMRFRIGDAVALTVVLVLVGAFGWEVIW
ncbi:MAG: energy-coupling factor transporter transmembrane component T [Bowdeniella nasicola]|nr:energy-coupling factor transporter transmembrane component T [Bowdeniella nasicola]